VPVTSEASRGGRLQRRECRLRSNGGDRRHFSEEDHMTDQRHILDNPRRRFVLRAAAGAGALMASGLATTPAAAGAKMSHKLVRYQPAPNAGAHCQTCTQYVPTPACKLVDDPITPTGWCLLYAAKAA
jgi:hypothetical protein